MELGELLYKIEKLNIKKGDSIIYGEVCPKKPDEIVECHGYYNGLNIHTPNVMHLRVCDKKTNGNLPSNSLHVPIKWIEYIIPLEEKELPVSYLFQV